MSNKRYASFSLAKLLFIILISIVLVASFTFAYYKNTQKYNGGSFSTTDFPTSRIIEETN